MVEAHEDEERYFESPHTHPNQGDELVSKTSDEASSASGCANAESAGWDRSWSVKSVSFD